MTALRNTLIVALLLIAPVHGAFAVDIDAIIASMTLDEKVGQMTQAERSSASPADVRNFFLGSILSGGGSAPASNTPTGWADMHDAYQNGALSTRLGIPILYGIDAVHGHNNVIGATIFPHNIGLGATRDPVLVEEIARITAKEVASTGLEWTFAPTVAVARDERWGRSYESFGEDPELQVLLAAAYVRGLQGTTMSGERVLACAKHFIGDGGTSGGIDRGNTIADEATLRSIHMPGFVEAIGQNVGTVMPSYSSWNGVKMHENRYLITDVLKAELGFDGFVISDWEAVYELSGPTYYDQVVLMVNAGVDMGMEPFNWRTWISTLKAAVNNGDVSMNRIDDAVRRILTIKERAGVFDEPLADRALVNDGTLGSAAHRDVAREAVRKSLVLLQNDGILPLSKSSRVFVAGKNADNIGYQCGGWTIAWQGGSGDITPGTSILDGIEAAVAGSGGSVTFSEDGSGSEGHDVAIVVIGETPYAEWLGDDPDLALDPADVGVLERLGDIPTVVVMVSGRPLMVSDRINSWDALVAAWLPGTEGDGVADVLFGDFDFTGKLSHSWPTSIAQVPINVGDADYDPLFAYGHGLNYTSSPPSVTITSPADNSTLASGVVEIEATASDSDGNITRVEFFEGSTSIGVDTEAPFGVSWNAAGDGCFSISARAFDDAGLSGTDSIDVTIGTGCTGEGPFGGSATAIPGVIEAENYNTGGQGVAYFDSGPGNNGIAYRDEDVDIEPSTENGFNVGWIDAGEWLRYDVVVAMPGTYTVRTRVASAAGGGSFRIERDGEDLSGTITAPPTGDWQGWTTVSREVDLRAGVQTLRLFVTESFDGFNINYLDFQFSRDCLPDVNEDGSLTSTDVELGLVLLVAANPSLDLDGNGTVDFIDFVDFLRLVDAGCE
ncbi:MAG: glycoside hydrolase family 3 N-terminal domain-containing protein [Planctomycetota bacterium]